MMVSVTFSAGAAVGATVGWGAVVGAAVGWGAVVDAAVAGAVVAGAVVAAPPQAVRTIEAIKSRAITGAIFLLFILASFFQYG
jgi:hypothetical protein